MAYEDSAGGGGGAFPPLTFNSSADEASAKRTAARKFDEWAGTVASFTKDVAAKLERDGEPVWSGPASEPFHRALLGDPAFTKKIPGYRNPYLDTAGNLRRSADRLEENRNR
ncbi:hypothetical protein ACIBH1_03565 [Nonomuraea sp. NPDC050663]|uniref:hypothetical protein n=1 Tax=Nonomuraea sp. NPDC050663 TaxID=3364370 RepID=UPI00378891F6